MVFAMIVALAVDAIQIALGPLGIFLVDEIADVVAMALISWAVGFHPLLLPTFVIEILPAVEVIPTWTGCTIAVLLLRKRAEAGQKPQEFSPAGPPPIKPANVIQDGPPQER